MSEIKKEIKDAVDFTENEQLAKVTKVQCFIQDELQAMNGGGSAEKKVHLLKIKNILNELELTK